MKTAAFGGTRHFVLFASVVALSSCLLFMVQPIVAKQLLPWFGGSSAVWITCLVFFQVVLLIGYGYAHVLTRYCQHRTQTIVHAVLLLIGVLFLPVIPGDFLKPDGEQQAGVQLVSALAITVGMPFLVLSTTAPLVQRWVAPRFRERSVYRLFAASNLGALGGLLVFPFVIEPFVSSTVQSKAWSIAYVAFTIGIVLLMRFTRVDNAAHRSERPLASPMGRHYLVWTSLAAFGSVALLATTSHLTQNIASVPFLWIVPLSIYLLSFILAFDGRGGEGFYARRWGIPATQISAVLMAVALTASQGVLHILVAVPLYSVGLLFVCLFCHGELALRRPETNHLTHFYLAIALGGAVGGILVTVLMPSLFKAFFELPWILFLIAVAGALMSQQSSRGIALIACLATCYYAIAYATFIKADSIWSHRNFYGAMRVQETADGSVRRFVHGVVAHGEQSTNAGEVTQPRTYFSHTSGGGRAIVAAQAQGPIRVGVIGLGVGTLATYARDRDVFRFYELDPDVLRVASDQFSYLRNASGLVEHVIGDARLSLERELAANGERVYDVFVVDAFSSDAIPVHLLTREAITLYFRILRDDGILAMHVSNKFLDLPSVISAYAVASGTSAKLVKDRPALSSGATPSVWVLLKKSGDWQPKLAGLAELPPMASVREWTDAYSSLLPVLKLVSSAEMANLIR